MAWFAAIPLVGKILDKIIPDKSKKLDKQIAEINRDESIQSEVERGKNQGGDVVLAESKGNFLQRSWRPMLAWIVIAVLINNTFLVPMGAYYLGVEVLPLSFPTEIPRFLEFAVLGYTGARTIEKLAGKTK